MIFHIPHYYPPFQSGNQIVNLGVGGPQSHMELQNQHLQISPTVYNVGLYGMAAGAMPRQVFQPVPVQNVNQYSNPITIENLIIGGIGKNPVQ